MSMSETFIKKFGVDKRKVITSSPETSKKVNDFLRESSAAAQADYERKLVSPSGVVLREPMTE